MPYPRRLRSRRPAWRPARRDRWIGTSPFSDPSDIPGLAAWYDASDTGTITHTGGLVDQWNDKSAAARHVTGTTTSRPTTGAATLSGLNVISFAGAERLNRTGFLYGLGACTVFVVGKTDVATTAFVAEGLSSDNDPTYNMLVNPETTAFSHANFGGTVLFNATDGVDVVDGQAHLHTWSDSGATASVWTDNGPATTASYTRSADTFDMFTIGGRRRGTLPTIELLMTGYVGEVVIFERVLAALETALVQRYLNDKWFPDRPHVEQGVAATVTTRTPTVTFLLPPRQDDVIVVWASSAIQTPTVTEPSGWVNVLGAGVGVASDSHMTACAYHVVTSAEALANTVAFSVTNWYSGTLGQGVGVVVHNLDPADPLDVAASTFDSAAPTTHVLAGVTPTETGCLVLSSVVRDAIGAYTTTPAGMGRVVSSDVAISSWMGRYLALSTASVAVGPTNITASSADEYASITVVMRAIVEGPELQTLTGSITAAGSLVKLTSKPLAGTSTGTGSLVKAIAKALAGSSTATGALATFRTVVQALTGSITGAGALARSISKSTTGSTAPTGDPNIATLKGLDGSVTGGGATVKAASKVLGGSSTPSGVLIALSLVLQTLTGSITAAGALARLVGKVTGGSATPSSTQTRAAAKGLSGALTPEGEPVNSVLTALVGSITGTGAAAKAAAKTLGGSSTPTGALSALRAIGQTLTGSITAVGSLAKAVLKLLVGSSTPTGQLSTGQLFFQSLSGAISGIGALVRSTLKGTSGELIPAGDPNNVTSKGLAGASAPTGTLSLSAAGVLVLSGVISAVGSIGKAISKTVAGASTPSGSIAKFIAKLFTGSITPTGALSTLRLIIQTLAGTVTAAGALAKAAAKTAVGALTPEGEPNQAVDKDLGGTVTPSGSLSFTSALTLLLTGSITAVGSLAKSVAKSTTGSISAVGSLVRATFKLFVGSITGTGTLETVGGVPNEAGEICLTVEAGVVTLVDDSPDACAILEAGRVQLDVV